MGVEAPYHVMESSYLLVEATCNQAHQSGYSVVGVFPNPQGSVTILLREGHAVAPGVWMDAHGQMFTVDARAGYAVGANLSGPWGAIPYEGPEERTADR